MVGRSRLEYYSRALSSSSRTYAPRPVRVELMLVTIACGRAVGYAYALAMRKPSCCSSSVCFTKVSASQMS